MMVPKYNLSLCHTPIKPNFQDHLKRNEISYNEHLLENTT
jgi:hypothetical protein